MKEQHNKQGETPSKIILDLGACLRFSKKIDPWNDREAITQ